MANKDWQSEISLMQEREQKARAILGISETADVTEIRSAFRRASLAHHPDIKHGDADAPRRFHLICCAYKFLIEGKACTALDEWKTPLPPPTDGKYRLDNFWGYWCWWRENYFG